MAANWSNPTTTSNYSTETLQEIKARDESLAKMDFASDTNIITGTIKYDSTTNRFAVYNGSTWDTIYPNQDSGDIKAVGHDGVSDGWLPCDGSAVSRITYASLFAAIAELWGEGDGSTTFNVPDFGGRILIGKDSGESAIDTVGKLTGSFDHSHSTPNHTHTMPNHNHSIPSHQHSIPTHYHGKGTLNITSSGSHDHDTQMGYANSGGTATALHRKGDSVSSYYTWTSSSENHTHSSPDFAGSVGNTGGVNGDAAMTSGSWSGTTGDKTSYSTDSDGASTSGPGNPPVATVNFMIKT